MRYSPIHKAIASVLCVSFALGVIIQYHRPCSSTTLQIVLLTSFGVLVLLQFIKTSRYAWNNHLHLLIVILFSASFGSYRLQQNFQPPCIESISSHSYIGTVLSYPEERENSYKVNLQIDSFYIQQNSHACKIKLLAYFEKTDTIKTLIPGQLITFDTQLQDPPSAFNPEGFNYRQYLAFKQIYTSTYITQERWSITPHIKKSLKISASHLQHYIVNQLQTLPFGDQELAVLSALTVGYKQFIDQDHREAYATSGVSHVLSVSGLHTGILFAFLSRIFFMFGKRKFGRWTKTLIIILLLWSFAFITGLSPSVCRATLMFSCMSIGIAQGRKSNIFNMVFLSAFILLIINPLNLFSLGFQLSYLAVIGILSFQAFLQKIFYEKWHIYKPLAELLSVAIAAQLGTFPIAIHTFNTFPLYFLLTNIWIIPLVAVILNAAILLIICCLSHIPCLFFAKVLNVMILVMNKGVSFISHLPYAQIKNIYLSESQTLLLYLALFLFALALVYHSKVFLGTSLLTTLFVCVMLLFHDWSIKDEMKIISFYHRNQFNLCIQQGKQATLFADKMQELPDYLIHHHLKGKALSTYSLDRTDQEQIIERQGDFWLFNGELMAIYNNDFEHYTSDIAIHTLFINKEEPQNLYQLYQSLHFRHLVLFQKPKNHYYYRKFCKKNAVHLHIIKQEGAYIASLSAASRSLASSN